ncbi:hypothetical protein [Kosmotoga pacifica]|uniref:Uncharacterized protein n=1 Tax=Kosmotoga pacifica TaxID=1330330 RepID=A0A0G2ZBN8_9BACT|nr:hypothetical protein [Kosmotoga pacifica]AKI96964.1 hypothetical protein IX53_03030 [Kosmotoga pacifica]
MRNEVFLLLLLLLLFMFLITDVMLFLTLRKLDAESNTIVVDKIEKEITVRKGNELYKIRSGDSKAFKLIEGQTLKIVNGGGSYQLHFLNETFEIQIQKVEVRLIKWDK